MHDLLGAVQRRLWRGQCVLAVRRALWGTTVLVLLVALALLAGATVPVGALLMAVGCLWALLLAWAAWQRPRLAACALWADRHLAGASAFTTWLETAGAPAVQAAAPAVQWLQQWAEQRAAASRRLLDERPAPLQLAKPLLVALVCSALAAAVSVLQPAPPTAVVGPSAAPSSPAAAPRDGKRDSLAVLPPATDTAPLLGHITQALRSAESREAAGRGAAGPGTPAAPGPPDNGPPVGPAPPGTAATAVNQAGPGAGPAGTPTQPPGADSAGTSSGASAGREAGDSLDQRADVGVSRPLRGPIPMPRSVPRQLAAAAEKRADLDRPADFGPDAATPGRATMRSGPAAAAAAPPPATDDTRLTTTQSGYVQAWMKASAQSR